MLKYARQKSPIYSILKNGVKSAPSDAVQSEIVVILCDSEQAEMLARVAGRTCPEAVPQLERWMRVACFELPEHRHPGWTTGRD